MKNQLYKQDEDLKKNESRGLRKNYNKKITCKIRQGKYSESWVYFKNYSKIEMNKNIIHKEIDR